MTAPVRPPAAAIPLVDAIFLDLGNVLVLHDNRMLCERLAAAGGRTAETVERALAPLWDACFRGKLAGVDLRRAVGEAAGAPLDEPTFRDIWSCHFRVYEEVIPLVASLTGRVKVFLLSNTDALHFGCVRPRVPILDRFDGFVLSYEVGLAKPDPEIFREALRRAGAPPERTAFFDDVEVNVAAARALGIRGHVFTTAAHFRTQLGALGLG